MMWTVFSLVLVSSLFVLKSEALQCYTCVGSSDEDCNRQGTQQCPGHSDACAVIRGQARTAKPSGVARCRMVGFTRRGCGEERVTTNRQVRLVQCGSVVGGVMKSCSFRSFCERAKRDGSRAPGVSVHCCYSNNCNAKSLASRVTTSMSYSSLLVFTLLWHPLLKLT